MYRVYTIILDKNLYPTQRFFSMAGRSKWEAVFTHSLNMVLPLATKAEFLSFVE